MTAPLDLDVIEEVARAADQGVWSIGQGSIETSGGFIECSDLHGNDHEANKRFIGMAGNPAVVLELVRLARIGQGVPRERKRRGVDRESDCMKCHRATGKLLGRLIVCPDCGNKRCPKASDHDLACTGSNEPGQAGKP